MRRYLLLHLVCAAPLMAGPRQPEELAVPMRDGASLAADLYRADGDGPAPAVVIKTPYNKNGFRPVFAQAEPENALLASDDYAFLVVDWRGRFGSREAGGPVGARLGEDGHDVVEWAAAQPWCNGKVGMWGPSALAQVQYRTAEMQPPHLVCCVPVVPRGDMPYDHFYPGGVLREEYVDTLDLLGFGLGRLVREHPTRDVAWRGVERLSWKPRQIAVPMLLIGGWYDIDLADMLRNFDDLRRHSPEPARSRHRMLIGPWSHSAVDQMTQGDLDCSQAVGEAGRAAWAWCEEYLRGQDRGERPLIWYYQMLDDLWLNTDRWPPAGTSERTLFLGGDRTLGPEPPGFGGGALYFACDPADPIPTAGGQVLKPTLRAGPVDQAPILARTDVLTFATSPLAEDLILRGPLRAELQVTAENADSTFAVRVACRVRDGRSILIGDGIRRVSHRHGSESPSDVPIGEVAALTIDIPSTAFTIPAGGALQVIVGATNWPRYENVQAADRLAVWVDEQHPSKLVVTAAE